SSVASEAWDRFYCRAKRSKRKKGLKPQGCKGTLIKIAWAGEPGSPLLSSQSVLVSIDLCRQSPQDSGLQKEHLCKPLKLRGLVTRSHQADPLPTVSCF